MIIDTSLTEAENLLFHINVGLRNKNMALISSAGFYQVQSIPNTPSPDDGVSDLDTINAKVSDPINGKQYHNTSVLLSSSIYGTRAITYYRHSLSTILRFNTDLINIDFDSDDLLKEITLKLNLINEKLSFTVEVGKVIITALPDSLLYFGSVEISIPKTFSYKPTPLKGDPILKDKAINNFSTNWTGLQNTQRMINQSSVYWYSSFEKMLNDTTRTEAIIEGYQEGELDHAIFSKMGITYQTRFIGFPHSDTPYVIPDNFLPFGCFNAMMNNDNVAYGYPYTNRVDRLMTEAELKSRSLFLGNVIAFNNSISHVGENAFKACNPKILVVPSVTTFAESTRDFLFGPSMVRYLYYCDQMSSYQLYFKFFQSTADIDGVTSNATATAFFKRKGINIIPIPMC